MAAESKVVGEVKDFVEAYDEPRHATVLLNEYVRIIRVQFPPQDVTLYHRHNLDSFYIHLETSSLQNLVVGKEPAMLNLSFGGYAYGAHEAEPFVHQIKGVSSDKGWDCIDGELVKQVPVRQDKAVEHEAFKLLLESPRVRMYNVEIAPGATVGPIDCQFYAVTTVMKAGTLATATETLQVSVGQTIWEEPATRAYTNKGQDPLQLYVTELL